MALAAGNLVYLAVGGGLMSEPPLFGVVDQIDGTAPNVVRVCWENGAQQTFASANEALNRLVAFTEGVPVPGLNDADNYNAGVVVRRLVTAGGTRLLVRLQDGYALVPG